jgi:hypothetical protein
MVCPLLRDLKINKTPAIIKARGQTIAWEFSGNHESPPNKK